MFWRMLWLLLVAFVSTKLLIGFIEDPDMGVASVRAAVFLMLLFVALLTYAIGRDDGERHLSTNKKNH